MMLPPVTTFRVIACIFLGSMVLNSYCVNAYKACNSLNIQACGCSTEFDCPIYSECISGYCHCLTESPVKNGTHIIQCRQCSSDSTGCPPTAKCKNNKCVCPHGFTILFDEERTSYKCSECSLPQHCPAFAECSDGKCKCKYGDVSTDITTGKVKECIDKHTDPIVVIAIAVPLAALLIGIAGVVAFYLYWRLNIRPPPQTDNKGFINGDERTYHLESYGVNPGADLKDPTPYQPSHEVQYDVKYDPKADNVVIHPAPPKEDTKPQDSSPVGIPVQQQTKDGSPQRSPTAPKESDLDLPVAPGSLYTNEDLRTTPVHYPNENRRSSPTRSREDLKTSPAHHRSRDDLRASPEHHHSQEDIHDTQPPRAVKGDFQSVPSHESDSEDDDEGGFPLPPPPPSAHVIDLQHPTEAPLLSSSTVV